MAIRLDPTFSALASTEVILTRDIVLSHRGYSLTPKACCFGYGGLPTPVFANLSDFANTRENDKFNFTLSVPAGYTVEANITSLKDNQVYPITNSTYGDYAAIGSLTNRPDIWGFVLNFFFLANNHGFGQYVVSISIKNSVGTVVNEYESPCFYLKPYECHSANKTVKIMVNQSGSIEGGFDWIGIEGNGLTPESVFGRYEVRTYGKLSLVVPETTSELIPDTHRRNQLIQRGIIKNYELELRRVSGILSNAIMYEYMLGNPVIVSDYNLDNTEVFDNVEVEYLEVLEVDKKHGNKQSNVKISLQEYRKDNIKRYY